MRPEELTAPERMLWAAFPAGAVTDLSGARDTKIRADVIAALLLGAADRQPGRLPALRLNGASITGQVNLAHADIGCLIRLTSCEFEQPPNLCGARTREIDLGRSWLPGLLASLCEVGGNLRMAGASCDGRLWLTGAHITGALELNDATLSNPGGHALAGNRLRVDGDLLCPDATVHGQFDVSGASIGGVLLLSKSTLSCPGGRAVAAFNTRVGARCRLRWVTVTGEVIFNDAEIGADFSMTGARLSNPDGKALHARGMSVGTDLQLGHGFTARGKILLERAKVAGTVYLDSAMLHGDVSVEYLTARELVLKPAELAGEIDLSHARVEILSDDPGNWPQRLRADGLSYERLEPMLPARRRLEWLARETSGDDGYQSLAAAYRRIGDDAAARRVLLARQRARFRRRPWYGRVWGQIQDVTVGYGYRPLRAGGWLLGLLVAGTLVFGSHRPPVIHGTPAPAFNAFLFTLDLLLPVVDLGFKHAYDPQGVQRWIAGILIAAGWLFATTIATGITRVLRRD